MFYDRIKALCEAHGMSISAAVRSVANSTGMIDGWRKGAVPRADIVVRLADLLNTSSDYLLERTDNPHPISDDSFVLDEIEKKVIQEMRTLNRPRNEISRKIALNVLQSVNSVLDESFFSPVSKSVNTKNDKKNYRFSEGRAAAGSPIFSPSYYDDEVEVDEKYLGAHFFIVQASGDSMIDAGINDGDYVVFQKDAYPDNGAIALIAIQSDTSDEPEYTIKHYHKYDGIVELRSANDNYPPMTYSSREAHFEGKMVDILDTDKYT